LLTEVDNRIYGQEDKVFAKPFNWQNLCDAMMLYCDQEMAKGVRLSAITRHMIGLFHGLPGARRYRQILSEEARLDTAKPEVIERAFGAVVLPSQIEDVA
ncbi:MAG: tRNA dihydrouridine(20/20a) synthase DusA, partial [Hyphomicrobiales bacterium]